MPEVNRIYLGDNREVLTGWPADFVDAVVTDPPYELGFMGKVWDSTGIAYSVELWREVLRVMKPGAHLLAFGGTRTYHRMACAIEDAGFEIRDQLQWIYGTGFPKSMNISIAIDRAKGEPPRAKAFNMKGRGERAEELDSNSRVFLPAYAPKSDESLEWHGWGTALKPANEPIVLARKPISEPTIAANVLKWGTGALNIEAARIEANDEQLQEKYDSVQKAGPRENNVYGKDIRDRAGAQPSENGRWPANVLFDQYAAGVLDGKSPEASRFFYVAKPDGGERDCGLDAEPDRILARLGGAQQAESNGEDYEACQEIGLNRVQKVKNNHPTVKPVDIISYLIQLITPRGGVVLDHFMGSGTTGIAAARLGHPFLGCEINPDYLRIAEKRIAPELGQGSLF